MQSYNDSKLTFKVKKTRHDKLKERIAKVFQKKGYDVVTEKILGDRRIDIFAKNNKEVLLIEIVDTSYSGPVGLKEINQIKIELLSKNKEEKQKTDISVDTIYMPYVIAELVNL